MTHVAVTPRHPAPAEPAQVPTLTGLRGWAALWVLVFHAWTLAGPKLVLLPLGALVLDLTPFFSIGWAGVQVFFVLSGFLLAHPFARWQSGRGPRPDVLPYLTRRLLRVFPAYYAQLALLLAIGWWADGQTRVADGLDLLRYLMMLFVPSPIGVEPINGVWWTLPIEFSFYLILPVLAVLLHPTRVWLLIIATLSSMMAWRYGTAIVMVDMPQAQRVTMSSQLPGAMDAFGIGMLAAMIHVHADRAPTWLRPAKLMRPVWPVFGLVLIIAAIYWMHSGFRAYWTASPIFFLWTPVFNLAVAALVLAAANGNPLTTRLFGNRGMVFVGTISYSVYLWHLPIIGALRNWPGIVEWQGYVLPPLLALALPLTLLVSTLSYVLIERPFMSLRRGRTSI